MGSRRQSEAGVGLTSQALARVQPQQPAVQGGKIIHFYSQLFRQIWLAGNSTFYTIVDRAVMRLRTELTLVHTQKPINKS